MMNKDSEMGLISACPRCQHQELVPESASSSFEEEESESRTAGVEMSVAERVFVNFGFWGICLAVLAVIVGLFLVMNHTFSAPQIMAEDGIGLYGSPQPKK